MRVEDLPPPSQREDLVVLLEQLKEGLVARATGSSFSDEEYARLRRRLLNSPVGSLLPEFLRTCRTLGEFWAFIKDISGQYAGRRKFLGDSINPVIDELEGNSRFGLNSSLREVCLLNQGGFGQVYKYHHEHLKMDFAIKFYAPAFRAEEDDTSDLDRFFQEARILFKLHHQDIVRVYDTGLVGRRPFIQMEYFPGRTLADILTKRGRVPVDRALWLLGRLAPALHYAHATGKVIHRDIKPSNIMVDKDTQQVRLVDFGLGCYIERDIASRITKVGERVAGGNYTAPELLADPTLLDPRSDIYSLGVLGYELITGCVPSPADDHVERLVDVGVGNKQAQAIRRCLMGVETRYSSLEEFIVDLMEGPESIPITLKTADISPSDTRASDDVLQSWKSEHLICLLPRGYVIIDDIIPSGEQGWAPEAYYFSYDGTEHGGTHVHGSYTAKWERKDKLKQCEKLRIPAADMAYALWVIDVIADISVSIDEAASREKLDRYQDDRRVVRVPEHTVCRRPQVPAQYERLAATGDLRDVAMMVTEAVDELEADSTIFVEDELEAWVEQGASCARNAYTAATVLTGDSHPRLAFLQKHIDSIPDDAEDYRRVTRWLKRLQRLIEEIIDAVA